MIFNGYEITHNYIVSQTIKIMADQKSILSNGESWIVLKILNTIGNIVINHPKKFNGNPLLIVSGIWKLKEVFSLKQFEKIDRIWWNQISIMGYQMVFKYLIVVY